MKKSKDRKCILKENNLTKESLNELKEHLKQIIQTGKTVNISFGLNQQKDKKLNFIFKNLRKVFDKKKEKLIDPNNSQISKEEILFKNHSIKIDYNKENIEEFNNHFFNSFYHVNELFNLPENKKIEKKNSVYKIKQDTVNNLNNNRKEDIYKKEDFNSIEEDSLIIKGKLENNDYFENNDLVQDLVIENFEKLPKHIREKLKIEIPKLIGQNIQIVKQLI